MRNPALKVNLLIRAETALARVRARRTANRIILSLIALVFVLIGVAMLNFAIYQAFVAFSSPGLAGLYVSLINLGLAAIIFFVVGKAGGESNEEKMAAEIRDLAYAEIGSDVDAFKAEVTKVVDDVNRIRSGFGSITGTSSIMPFLGMLTKAITKK
jgi:high-affinity K+ transport system ATPase subunit B